MTKQLSVKVSERDVQRCDEIVARGDFTTRSDLLRYAIRRFLDSKERIERVLPL